MGMASGCKVAQQARMDDLQGKKARRSCVSSGADRVVDIERLQNDQASTGSTSPHEKRPPDSSLTLWRETTSTEPAISAEGRAIPRTSIPSGGTGPRAAATPCSAGTKLTAGPMPAAPGCSGWSTVYRALFELHRHRNPSPLFPGQLRYGLFLHLSISGARRIPCFRSPRRLAAALLGVPAPALTAPLIAIIVFALLIRFARVSLSTSPLPTGPLRPTRPPRHSRARCGARTLCRRGAAR